MSSDNQKILSAAGFAARKHSTQRRKDVEASPYINHPLGVAELLTSIGGVEDTDVLCAALLHDTVEDTETTLEELEREFGPTISNIVSEVSDDKSLPKLERKRQQVEKASKISHQAKLVKLADKICNLRDIATTPPVDWGLSRRQEYFEWAKEVVDLMRGTNLDLETTFDNVYKQKPKGD